MACWASCISLLVLALIGVGSTQRCLVDKLSENCRCLKTPRIQLQCAKTNLTYLYPDFQAVTFSGDLMSSFQVRDSDLNGLEQLPESFYGIETLELGNVQMEIGVINDILKSLDGLKHFVYDNAHIPKLTKETLILSGQNMNLESLKLMNNEIGQIDERMFENMNSLKVLHLSNNNLKRIPKALYTLKNLEELDLTGNDISNVSKEEVARMEVGLSKLTELKMDRINCNCDLSKQEFYNYIQTKRFHSIVCSAPEKFEGASVSTLQKKDLCNNSNIHFVSSSLFIVLTCIWINKWTS